MGSEVGLGFLDLCRDADPEDQPAPLCSSCPVRGSEIRCRFEELETEKLQ